MATQLELEVILAAQGGLSAPIPGGEWRTVLGVGGEHWSVRLRFPGELPLGQASRVQADFLFPEAFEHFPAGTQFTVWHGGVVGSGRVLAVAA